MSTPATPGAVSADVIVSVGTLRVDDAIVRARPQDIEALGLRFVGTNVEVVDEIPVTASGPVVTLSVAGGADVRELVRTRLGPGSTLGLITPVSGGAWRECLEACATNSLAVRAVTLDGPLVHLEIGTAGEISVPLGRMLENWLDERARAIELAQGSTEAVTGLVHLIRAVEGVGTVPAVPVVAQTSDAALRGAVIARDRRLEVLTRRYDALSGSKLGRLTLAWWQFRNKGRRRDN